MNKTIIIEYATETLTIECDGKQFDAEQISGVDISEWAYPFMKNNYRWNGLYEELKNFCGSETFSLEFNGAEDKLEILKQALSDKPVRFIGKDNKVVIIYKKDPLTTKMTINGKIYDTSRITDKTIEEWVVPFSNNGIEWKGIFAEIEEFIGTNTYAIQFMGNPDEIRIIMDNCPQNGNINISYKEPIIPKKKSPVLDIKETVKNTTLSRNPISNNSKPNLNAVKGKTKGFISNAKKEGTELKTKEPYIFLFGQISVILAVVCCLLSILIVTPGLLILSIIPAIVFSILIFTKGYKKLAICTFLLVLIIAIISFILVYIRWDKEMNDFDDDFEDDAKKLDPLFDAAKVD